MSFRFIRDHAGRWSIRLMCRGLAVSASGYYAWRNSPACARASTASIMAVTAAPGSMRRFVRKAGRQAVDA